MAVQPIPQGYHRVNIDLIFQDASKPLELYRRAFGGEQRLVIPGAGGKGIMHAELRIADTVLFLADDVQRTGKTVEAGYAAAFVPHLWVTDTEMTWKRAVDAGCKEIMPLALQFWGDRYGQVVDPFGLRWAIATHVEDVSAEEMKKRAEKELGKR